MTEMASVIIAVYNEEDHIGQCLESLLGQSYPELEILVVDDGSTDRTAAVVRGFPEVRLIRQKHLGKARAVNRAAKIARGKVLFFLDGDMYFDREYVARMMEPIVAGRAVGTAHTEEYVANQANPWAACWQVRAGLPLDQRMRLKPADLQEGSTIYRAVRKDRFLAVGGFEDTGFLDDQTLYPKLKEKAQFVKETICYHYNPETLHQVFRTGIWGGKSTALRFGWRGMARYMPLVTPFRAVRSAIKYRRASVFFYELAYDLGVFCGMFKCLSRLDLTFGK
jgi:glycosyltransferase involved in cell wall biosynthesis